MLVQREEILNISLLHLENVKLKRFIVEDTEISIPAPKPVRRVRHGDPEPGTRELLRHAGCGGNPGGVAAEKTPGDCTTRQNLPNLFIIVVNVM
jgi:hypothetical protein